MLSLCFLPNIVTLRRHRLCSYFDSPASKGTRITQRVCRHFDFLTTLDTPRKGPPQSRGNVATLIFLYNGDLVEEGIIYPL